LYSFRFFEHVKHTWNQSHIFCKDDPSILLLGCLFVDSRHDPGFWGDELFRWNTKLKETRHCAGKVLEPQILAVCISLCVFLERLVLNKNEVGSDIKQSEGDKWKRKGNKSSRQHHQRAGFLILKLLWSFPVLPNPLFVEKKFEVIISYRNG